VNKLAAVLVAVAAALLTAACERDSREIRWAPSLNDTWQWQLAGPINTGYDAIVYDIDLFDAPETTIDSLHAQGRRVVCYFSAGSSEEWRSDFGRFDDSDIGHQLDEWPGERWLDTRSLNVREILRGRLDLARSKGCDGVEPDNVDGYLQHSGFDLDAATQLDFNRFLADEAHERGLAAGLKNALEQIPELVTVFDFAVNEQCFEYAECEPYADFVTAGKPVFNAEYAEHYRLNEHGERDDLCQSARAAGIRTLVLPRDLDDSLRFACD
jgi:hypothetical protein